MKFFIFPRFNIANMSKMEIVPKPIKTEYENLKHTINEWCTSPEKFPVPNAVIDLTKLATLVLPVDEMKVDSLNGLKKAALKGIYNSMNVTQRKAIDQARNSPISVVQGPPGTG